METDSFFCQLFKQLPEALFELIGEPPMRAKSYRFDSVELKKSFRIDGLFLPKKPSMPLYFVEVQFQRVETFYANLFAKVFSYLNENCPWQDWRAVAIFPSRREAPQCHKPYDDLLASKRCKRIYLNELVLPPDPPLGLGILRMVNAPEEETWSLAGSMIEKAKTEIPDRGLSVGVVQLIEELLCRRFTHLTREEISAMFKLSDIRESKVWQDGREEGRGEGRGEGREEGKLTLKKELAKKLLAEGKALKEIADFLDVPLAEIRRWAHA